MRVGVKREGERERGERERTENGKQEVKSRFVNQERDRKTGRREKNQRKD